MARVLQCKGFGLGGAAAAQTWATTGCVLQLAFVPHDHPTPFDEKQLRPAVLCMASPVNVFEALSQQALSLLLDLLDTA